MTKPLPLSCHDLPMFFGPWHAALAVRLDQAAPAIAALDAGAGTLKGAVALARAMGRDHGLYAHLLPHTLGGIAGPAPVRADHVDVRGLCLIREMLGYVSPTADSIFAVQGLGTYPVVLAGSPAQREDLIPRVLAGDSVGAFGLTEPGAGSDVSAIATTASTAGDGYELNGAKTFISNVGIASHFTIFANADPAQGRKGITAFLVTGQPRGMTCGAIPMSVDHPIGRIEFTACRIPSSARLGEAGQGFKLAMQTLDTFRVTVGAAAVGMARRALEEAARHAAVRQQFGKPLAEQQQIQAAIAQMATELDAARLLVYRAAYLRDHGQERVTKEVAMAKMYATEAAFRIIDSAVQIFGGLGVVRGNPAERLYREIRPLRIYEGTTQIQNLIIAPAVIKELTQAD